MYIYSTKTLSNDSKTIKVKQFIKTVTFPKSLWINLECKTYHLNCFRPIIFVCFMHYMFYLSYTRRARLIIWASWYHSFTNITQTYISYCEENKWNSKIKSYCDETKWNWGHWSYKNKTNYQQLDHFRWTLN